MNRKTPIPYLLTAKGKRALLHPFRRREEGEIATLSAALRRRTHLVRTRQDMLALIDDVIDALDANALASDAIAVGSDQTAAMANPLKGADW
jgi:hypothetical protein